MSKDNVISKDVIFEEDKMWNWGESYAEQIKLYLEWGDEVHNTQIDSDDAGDDAGGSEETARIEAKVLNENTKGKEAIFSTPEASNDNPETSNARDIHPKRAPAWMTDYDVSNVEVQAEFASFE